MVLAIDARSQGGAPALGRRLPKMSVPPPSVLDDDRSGLDDDRLGDSAALLAPATRPGKEAPMLIDCDSCEVRGDACSGCVMTVLLGMPPGVMEIDDTERRALDALAVGGLVPPLRLVLRAAEAG